MHKKFINNPSELVKQVLQATVSLNENLMIIPNTQAIGSLIASNNIGLICGGGSGHEPAHAGFVDPLILTAAVCGNVFSSPPYQHILKSIQYVNTLNQNNGVILIIKNYTGDVLNFGLAQQLARQSGILVESIIVGDDITFINEDNAQIELYDQRRGLAGAVLLYKILGGAANSGLYDFNQLYQLGLEVNKNLFTFGVSLTSCCLPGQLSHQEIEENSMEIGLGIHGEKGLQVTKLQSSKEIIQIMLKKFQNFIKPQDEVVLLLNNLGSTTSLEISQLTLDILLENQNLNWNIRIFISGTVMSSLEMHGISITVLKLTDLVQKSQIIEYLLQQTSCTAWQSLIVKVDPKIKIEVKNQIQQTQEIINPLSKYILEKIESLCKELLNHVEYLNQLDGQVGDGDLGQSVFNGCNAILQLIQQQPHNLSFSIIADKITETMGGSSGPLIGSFLFGFDEAIRENSENINSFLDGFKRGTLRMKQLGGAKLGDRTMMDVLEPISDYIQQTQFDQTQIIEKCQELVQQVRQLKARKGRSRYLAGKEIGHPEPGCELINLIIQYLLKQK